MASTSSKARLRTEKPPRQQRLHVSAAVGYNRDVYRVTADSIENPVGLEKYLPIIPLSDGKQFGRVNPAVGKLTQR